MNGSGKSLCFIGSAVCVLSMTIFCGCGTDYRWRTDVPKAMRTVCVPTLRNDSDVMELGAIVTRQILREFQREGTYRIRPQDEAALEVQGVVQTANAGITSYNRRSGGRYAAYDYSAQVEISVIDKRSHKVLVNNKVYTAHAPLTAGQDIATAMRDASGRLADDLARQVVDDMLKLKWEVPDNE